MNESATRLCSMRGEDHGVRPFLRWAGSKRQLIPQLSRYLGNGHSRYIEPFAGSASLFFSACPTSAVLGDINGELMSTYDQVRNSLGSVLDALRVMKKGRDEYLRIREIDPQTLPPPVRAARFIYLNRYCFNGLYRTNLAGKFNVPYGGDRTGKLPADGQFERCSELLQRAELVVGGFDVTLREAKTGDFVYMDPPFTVGDRRIFKEYDATGFSSRQLEDLRSWILRLDEMNVAFLVSYAESVEADYLAEGFHCQSVAVRRNIAGFAGSRRKATEILISNRTPSA
jgi:DNA adenine methylase